jgi:predicted membrane protein
MNGDPYTPAQSPRTVAYGPLIWGAILVVVGAGWLLAALDVVSLPWRALLAAILIVIGIAMVSAYARGEPPGGLFGAGVTMSVVLALLSSFSATFSLPLSGGVGERTYSPTIGTLESAYNLMAGELTLDLAEVDLPDGDTHLEVGVTFGRIVIEEIPSNIAVAVDARATAGEVAVFNSRWDGINVKETVTDPGFSEADRRLIIDVRVGFGQIEVHR